MPCWQRRTQTVDVGQMHLDVLTDGLRADAWTVSVLGSTVDAYQVSTGTAVRWTSGAKTLEVLSGSARSAGAAVKRAYTRGAFNAAAKKHGFTVATDRKGRATATRRRFSR